MEQKRTFCIWETNKGFSKVIWSQLLQSALITEEQANSLWITDPEVQNIPQNMIETKQGQMSISKN